MAYPEESNIGGSKGRPLGSDGRGRMINPARRAGFSGIRDAMRGYEDQISHRDRVKARNLDARMARSYQTLPTSAIPSSAVTPASSPVRTVPAVGGNLDARRGLFANMEKAGSGAITPEMRDRARSLGVADGDFNSAVDRIRTNEGYTPAWKTAPTIPGSAPATSMAVPKTPRTPTSAPAGTPGSPIQGPPAPKINKATGLPMGADPRDPASGYNKSWRTGTPYQQDDKPAEPKFGAEIATKNLAEKGLNGAVEDYRKRSRAYKTPPMI